MDQKALTAVTLDEMRNDAYSVLNAHDEHMQQLAVFLLLPLKFKHATLNDIVDEPLSTLSLAQHHAAHNYVLGIYNAMLHLSDYEQLRQRVEDMRIEWYYISHLESVFVHAGGLTCFLSWVARNQITEPLQRAFLLYLDAVYANGIPAANWEV